MSEKTLKFDNIRVNENEFHKFKQPINLDWGNGNQIVIVNANEFHKSKQPINLDWVNGNQIVISDKFKHSDGGFKYFIGYKKGETIKSLCIILPQMSGYIK